MGLRKRIEAALPPSVTAERKQEFSLQYRRRPKILRESRRVSRQLVHLNRGFSFFVLEETNNMLSDSEFSRMKKGVVLINTARGSLVDPSALIRALRDGRVAAAGLDVMPDEPMIREETELICSFYCGRHDLRNLVADHVLLRMPNVIVTPHSAFNTREAVSRISKTTVKNIEAFLEGKPQNVV